MKTFECDWMPQNAPKDRKVRIMKSNKVTTSIPFHQTFSPSLTTGTQTTQLTPAQISARVSALSDNFELYRLTRLKFKIHPCVSQAAEVFCAAFYSNILDTTASFSGIVEGPACAIISGKATVPTNWVNVPKACLAGALPWYKAQAGAPDPWEEVAGVLVLASDSGASSASLTIEVDGVIEFKNAVDPSYNPRTRERAREKVLALLAPSPAVSSDSVGSRMPTQSKTAK